MAFLRAKVEIDSDGNPIELKHQISRLFKKCFDTSSGKFHISKRKSIGSAVVTHGGSMGLISDIVSVGVGAKSTIAYGITVYSELNDELSVIYATDSNFKMIAELSIMDNMNFIQSWDHIYEMLLKLNGENHGQE